MQANQMSIPCPGCGSDNPSGTKFCTQCGVALPRVGKSPREVPEQYTEPMDAETAAAKGAAGVESLPEMVIRPDGLYVATSGEKDIVKRRSKTTGVLLEVVPGLFGFLGFGWLYAGNIGAWLAWLIAFSVFSTISVILDFSVLFICVHIPAHFILIAASAAALNSYMTERTDEFQ